MAIGSHSLGTQSRQIHDVEMAKFQLEWTHPGEKKPFKTELLQIPGRTFRKEGLGKDVTDKFLAGLPGCKRGLRWPDYFGALDFCIACRSLPEPFVWNFSGRRVMRFKHRRNQRLPRQRKQKGGAILAGLEHLDERYLKAVGYTTKSKRGVIPKMALFWRYRGRR